MTELLNNREYRQKLLKQIIKDLHAGHSVEDVKERFQELLEHVGATEISQMEQKLIEEGMPVEEIQRLCDVHTAVFRDTLDAQTPPGTEDGHPVQTFKEENKALAAVIAKIEKITEQIRAAATGEDISALLDRWRRLQGALLTIEKHFSRKENILFPYLEKHGITGPPSVMWGLHDEIRANLKEINALLERTGHLADKRLTQAIADLVLPTLHSISELFYKEENILFPMSLETLSPDEWQEIFAQSHEVGYALVTAPEKWQAAPRDATPAPTTNQSDFIKLDTGVLNLEQLNSLLKTLPFDLTFVDKDDIVRYYSAGKERIFTRTPAVIGRKVQFCHPPDSVHVVSKIVEDFKQNKRASADFWLQMQDRFVYIRYLPVHNDNGEFLGVLEITQDIKEIQQLRGEKRILSEE
jgi:DUF438 domain-containing protein